MRLTSQHWGELGSQSQAVMLFSLENSQGSKLMVSNYGCIVRSLITADRQGVFEDIVLGYNELEQYVAGHPFFGAVAGRYANRIAQGRFQLDGQPFQLETNELATMQHLHGGSHGFDKALWDYAIDEQDEAIFIHFSRVATDGESGYPGNLLVTHSIGLDELNQVHYNFSAVTDQATVVNLVNHSYYNLAGHGSGSTDNHLLQLNSHFYTPVDQQGIPTGEIRTVQHSGLDFRQLTAIGDNKAKLGEAGFDHNYIIDNPLASEGYRHAATLYEPLSGRCMEVFTTQPALQFYNGFKLSNKRWIGKHDQPYLSCQGICLETQHYPDSPNHSHFPSTRLNPGQVFEQKTLHRFSVR